MDLKNPEPGHSLWTAVGDYQKLANAAYLTVNGSQ